LKAEGVFLKATKAVERLPFLADNLCAPLGNGRRELGVQFRVVSLEPFIGVAMRQPLIFAVRMVLHYVGGGVFDPANNLSTNAGPAKRLVILSNEDLLGANVG